MSILNSNTSCTLYKHVIIFVCSLAVCCRALEETELMAGSLVLSEQMLTASTEVRGGRGGGKTVGSSGKAAARS